MPRGLGSLTVRPDGTGIARLTDACYEAEPAWSPDGTTLAFTSGRDGSLALATMRADGTGFRELTSSRAASPARPGRPTAAGSPSRAGSATGSSRAWARSTSSTATARG